MPLLGATGCGNDNGGGAPPYAWTIPTDSGGGGNGAHFGADTYGPFTTAADAGTNPSADAGGGGRSGGGVTDVVDGGSAVTGEDAGGAQLPDTGAGPDTAAGTDTSTGTDTAAGTDTTTATGGGADSQSSGGGATDTGPSNGFPPSANDKDGDGYTVQGGDCDDNDKTINPGAKETCNGKDNDCTGIPDDVDMDGDGFSVCTNDCDDTDININPLAGRDCTNGKDNDCSGIIDAKEDGDGDGFAGCQDCDDYDKTVNKAGFELPADLIDNDCDGQTDELPQACDTGALNTFAMADYAKAIDLCTGVGTTVVNSTFTKQAAISARAIKTSYGTNLKPQSGKHMVVLSSGNAAAKGQLGYKNPQPGTKFSNSAPYPKVKCKNSGTVYDYTEWKLTLKVPMNVKSFAFDFNFMSSEFPEWVGSKYNDKFLAILDSKKFKGNISFDSKGGCVSINNAFFTVCKKCKGGDKGLLGTGYEGAIGGGTGWLTTTSPVTPGETITLRFIVFDEGDHVLDSAVVIDNFRWQTLAAGGGSPSTVRPGG